MFALALPETLIVGTDNPTVTDFVALALAVLVSVAVTVMVFAPEVVKMWAALVALVPSVWTALPSPQSTVKLESVELAAAVAVMPSEYEIPVSTVALPVRLTVGCDRLTVTSCVALAVVVLVSVAVTVMVGVPAAIKLWVALVALVARVCRALPSPQLTVKLARLEPAAGAAVMLKLYDTPVSAVALPETVTVGSGKLRVRVFVAVAMAVLVSVAVTVMVGVPTAVKVCDALVALMASVSSALPSPQSTLRLESVEPGAAVAVMPNEYIAPVSTVELPEMATVGCDKLTTTPTVALAVRVLVSVATTVTVRLAADVKVCVALVAGRVNISSALPSPQSTVTLERVEPGAAAAVMLRL